MSTFLELRFWNKTVMPCAGAIPFRRDCPATTMILSLQAKHGMILLTMLDDARMCGCKQRHRILPSTIRGRESKQKLAYKAVNNTEYSGIFI